MKWPWMSIGPLGWAITGGSRSPTGTTPTLKPMTDEPEDRPPSIQASERITFHDSASVASGPLSVRVSDFIEIEDSAHASPPLVHMGGTAIYPTAGASQVQISPRPGSPIPDVEVSLNENIWDMTTTGLGVGIGAVVGHVPGAVVGGVGMYAWRRWRWAQVQRKRNDSGG